MDNLSAISIIKKLNVPEYETVLSAAQLLPAEGRKIAVIGKKSTGKTKLLNRLAPPYICKGNAIKKTIVYGDIPSKNTLLSNIQICKDNNIKSLLCEESFVWGVKGAEIRKISYIDELAECATDEEFGGFLKTSSSNLRIFSQETHLLVAPDLPTKVTLPDSSPALKEIKNVFDVSDIIILVGYPEEFQDTTFDFVLSDKNLNAKKTIILAIIHETETNFFHFPFGNHEKAKSLEQERKESATGLYNLINHPSSPEGTKQNLRKSIIEEAQDLIKRLEEFAEESFSKFQIKKIFFLPTAEKKSNDQIIEDKDLIDNVFEFQMTKIFKAIYELSKSNSIAVSQTPYIAWQYFFRKIEDICLDVHAAKCIDYKKELVDIYARLQVLEVLISDQKNELVNMLRDYSPAFPKEKCNVLELYYKEYCAAQDKMLGKKDAVVKVEKKLNEFISENTEYLPMRNRIKTQLGIDLSGCFQIMIKTIKDSAGDFERFKSDLQSHFAITSSILEKSPLVIEQKRLHEKLQNDMTREKSDMIKIFEDIISIAEKIELAECVQLINAKRHKINVFSAEGLLCK